MMLVKAVSWRFPVQPVTGWLANQVRWYKTVCMLKDIGIHSLYHHTRQEEQGQEKEKTFFMHRKLERPYHIDYCFVSEDLLDTSSLNMGNPKTWLEASDHVPLELNMD